MKNIKKGDKIRCINPNFALVADKIYTFDRYDDEDDELLFVEGTDESFFTVRFEVVDKPETMKELVNKAYDILQSGKIVTMFIDTYTPESIEIFTKPTNRSSALVTDDIKRNGFSVALRMTNDLVIPVNQLTIVSNIVKDVGDYEAIVEKDFIKVGCQFIPWSKVEEIVELHKKLS
jgi:hypothetical protein